MLALAITAVVLVLLALSWVDNTQVEGKTLATHYVRLTNNYELKERQTAHHTYYSVIADHHDVETLIHEQIVQSAELKDGYAFKNTEDFYGQLVHDNYFFVPKKGTQIDFYDQEKELKHAHGSFTWKKVSELK